MLKVKEQLNYFFWKQIILPYQSKQLGCSVLFCSDFMVPYFSLGIKTIPVFHDAFFWEYPEHYNKYWLVFFRNLYKEIMVRMGGLEPPCLRTRPSNVRVYQFHHIRSEGVSTLWKKKNQLFRVGIFKNAN